AGGGAGGRAGGVERPYPRGRGGPAPPTGRATAPGGVPAGPSPRLLSSDGSFEAREIPVDGACWLPATKRQKVALHHHRHHAPPLTPFSFGTSPIRRAQPLQASRSGSG